MSKRIKCEKLDNLIFKIRECLDNGTYRFSKHALERRNERAASLPDVIEVLYNGYHEKIKDTWDDAFNAWNYSIRGNTIDNDTFRIIVSFEDNGLLIITVIRLD